MKHRLALLAPELAAHGGIQSYMWRLFEVLQAAMAASDERLPTLWSVNDDTDRLRHWGGLPPEAPVLGGKRRKLRFSFRVLAGVRHRHVVVGHVRQAPLAAALRLMGRTAGYTVILHGIEAWERLPLLQRLACRWATRVVATTQHTAQRFAQANGLVTAGIEVIPLCADERPLLPDAAFTLAGACKVLTVGRQWANQRYKGYDELIEATSRLQAQGQNITLHLVGQGDDQPRLRSKAAELGVAAQVHFHSGLSDAQLAAAYDQCDLFAMPSGAEGFGIAFLEAMRHGKPCIGAREGGAPEVIRDGETGLLVPYGDVSALVAALATLAFDESMCHRMGQAALRDIDGKFSASQFHARHLAEFRKLFES